MKTLALRIYLTVVAVLLIFALISGWMAQQNLVHERSLVQTEAASRERAAAWGELIENSLPPVTAPQAQQAQVFLDWSNRLRLPMALSLPNGERIATSALLEERMAHDKERRPSLQHVVLSDGRILWMPKRYLGGSKPRPTTSASEASITARSSAPSGLGAISVPWLAPWSQALPSGWVNGAPALLLSLFVLFVAVAIGAWPVVHHLTRRLTALRQGVEQFGSGQLNYRVAIEGKDEVAALAQSFNEAAQRIEDLVVSNRSLLANASHELRSPLARLKMAVSVMADMPADKAAAMRAEIHQDIRELDALVEEVLLASRLDTRPGLERGPMDLISMAVEEASRVNAALEMPANWDLSIYQGEERLVRRAVRNLLENAKRYGSEDVVLHLSSSATHIQIQILDRGPGVPEDQRDRIFEPFYRMPGHAEHAGGVGLGLSLVRQIALKHGGSVKCEPREGGGSAFVIELPIQPS